MPSVAAKTNSTGRHFLGFGKVLEGVQRSEKLFINYFSPRDMMEIGGSGLFLLYINLR